MSELGMTAASAVAGGVIGMGMSQVGQSQQRRQAEYLQQLQIRGNKEMTEFNRGQQEELWRNTNAKAQASEYRKAGLNVGLMYGGAGSGGQSGLSAGNVSGQAAADNSGVMQQGMGMMLNNELTRAQVDATQAQTDKTKAETEKISGVDTEDVKAGIGLKGVMKEAQEIQNRINGQTETEQVMTIQATAGKVQGEMNSAIANGTIANETVRTQIEQAKASLAQTYIENRLKKAGIKYTEAQTKAIADNVAIAYMNAYSNRRNAMANERNSETQLHGQIKDAMYKEGLIELGERKLDQDVVMGVANILTGHAAQSGETETRTTKYNKDGDYDGEVYTNSKRK